MTHVKTSDLKTSSTMDTPLRTLASHVLDIEARGLITAKNKLDDNFERTVTLIHHRCPPGKVVVMGVGKSGHIGHKIAATLASTGTPSFFVHPTEAGHGDLGMLSNQDVVLAISYSGSSEEILRLGPYLKRHGIPMIALTGNKASALAGIADAVIDGHVDEEACPLGLAPTASTTVALALGDALAVCLLDLRGFKAEDFAMTHPSGKLGRRLLVRVRDVMLQGKDVPIVSLNTSIRESLIEMSRGGIGMTAVSDETGQLKGIFTDGDLRRALDKNFDIHSTSIAQVMSTHPKTIIDTQLATAAVELMERSKITAVLVVDLGGKLVGALNMRQLLQAGVV